MKPVILILPLALFCGAASAEEDDDDEVSIYMNDRQFVEGTVASQSDAIIKKALKRLQHNYHTRSIGRKEGRPKKEDCEAKAASANGVTLVKVTSTKCIFAIDWEKAGADIQIRVKPKAKLPFEVWVTSKPENPVVVDVFPPTSSPIVEWNCDEKPLPRKLTKGELKSTEKLDRKTKLKESIEVTDLSVKSSSSSGSKDAPGGSTAVQGRWFKKVTRKFEEMQEIKSFHQVKQDEEIAYTIPPYSSTKTGIFISSYTEKYAMKGEVVFDTQLQAYLPALNFAVKLGKWSEFSPSEKRSTEIESNVVVSRIEKDVLISNPTKWGSAEACFKGQRTPVYERPAVVIEKDGANASAWKRPL